MPSNGTIVAVDRRRSRISECGPNHRRTVWCRPRLWQRHPWMILWWSLQMVIHLVDDGSLLTENRTRRSWSICTKTHWKRSQSAMASVGVPCLEAEMVTSPIDCSTAHTSPSFGGSKSSEELMIHCFWTTPTDGLQAKNTTMNSTAGEMIQMKGRRRFDFCSWLF